MIIDEIIYYWPQIVTFLSLALTLSFSAHVILNKRDSRAAISWVGIIWLVPLLGCFLYYLFGINRVRRLAKELRNRDNLLSFSERKVVSNFATTIKVSDQFGPLIKLGQKVTNRELTPGNAILPLLNGDEAYPEMLQAIKSARHSITLSTYIFDNDKVGNLFIHSLEEAIHRGVEVRVLIDDIGLRYSFRPVMKKLKASRIPVARFMGALRPMTFPHLNLRKHRKIMVVDGFIGFTGGINIREGHWLSMAPKHPVQDLHFKLEGPIVEQLQNVFVDDWFFTTKEKLSGHPWFSETQKKGETYARVVSDGPDDDIFKLPLMIEGAISCASKSIWVLTPYFLPELSLSRALKIAASKGIKVNIILPGTSNIALVQWASNPDLKDFLVHGCEVWQSRRPFDHSKLILIDDEWFLLGSANLDPRSLRLNFEMNVECYDKDLGRKLHQLLLEKIRRADRVTLEDLDRRNLALKLRDGTARLFSPYL